MEMIYLNQFNTFEEFFAKLSTASIGDVIYLDLRIYNDDQDYYNKIAEMNKMIDYLKEYGQKLYYRTLACFPSKDLMTFDGFMAIERISEELQTIIKNNNYDDAHIIRLIETYLAKNMRVLYTDTNSSCLFNLAQSIKLRLGTCRHFNYLDHYLLTRNSVMSFVASNELKTASHTYLIAHLKEIGKWTCIDATWSAQDISMETGSSWSFLSYTDMLKYDSEGHHALCDGDSIDLDTISLTNSDIYALDKDIGLLINNGKDFYLGQVFPFVLKAFLSSNKKISRRLKEDEKKNISNNIMKATLLLSLWSKILDLRGKTPVFYVSKILSYMIPADSFCKAKFYFINDENKDSSNVIVSVRDVINGEEEYCYFVHAHTDSTFIKYSKQELIEKFGGKIKIISSDTSQPQIYGIDIERDIQFNHKILPQKNS